MKDSTLSGGTIKVIKKSDVLKAFYWLQTIIFVSFKLMEVQNKIERQILAISGNYLSED